MVRYGAAMTRTRVVVVATLAATLGAWWLQPDVSSTVRVTQVADGDTITVQGHTPNSRPETVRLLGVDTPETHHPKKGVQCFGPEASAATAEHLLGKQVTIELGLQPKDVYGRTLARVIIDGKSFSEWLVSHGYARVLIISPNDSDARRLIELEQQARLDKRGLWGACA